MSPFQAKGRGFESRFPLNENQALTDVSAFFMPENLLLCTIYVVARCSQEFEHDVDVSIEVEKFKAHSIKNRFGGKEEINV